MRRARATVPALALTVLLAIGAGATANAQTVPLGTPPNPAANPTANVIFDAMLATARAAATNPRSAQPASVNTSAAIERYNAGDINGARAAAIAALIDANRAAPDPIPVLRSTIPQTSALQTAPFPLPGGSVAAIDADAFVAQARGAVAACQATRSSNAAAAAASLGAAQRDAQAGRYQNVRVEARAAVDICAQATLQQNAR